MRIACLHIPQFALQCVTRVDPSLVGGAGGSLPVAVVGSPGGSAGSTPGGATATAGGAGSAQPPTGAHGPVVHACSRAAWSLGVRVGMPGTAARSLGALATPPLQVVAADSQLERDTARAIADCLLSLSAVVDAGGRVGTAGAHLAVYCEVPPRTRGTSFGERVIAHLATLGLTCRVGIADDRFTAWVAASHAGDGRSADTGVVSVPRGGSAAFLAPRPLSLLAIDPEVQHMLESLGVTTLGKFASLPAPSIHRRSLSVDADYLSLARGDSGQSLRPYTPDAPIREEAHLCAPHPASHPAPGRTAAGTPAHGVPQLSLLPGATTGATTAAPAGAAGSAATAGASAPSASAGQPPAPCDPLAAASTLSGPAAIALLANRLAHRLAGRARGAARLEITVSSSAGETTIPLTVPDRGALESAEDLAQLLGAAIPDLGNAWHLRAVVTGEALVGADAATAAATATVSPGFTLTAVPSLPATGADASSAAAAAGSASSASASFASLSSAAAAAAGTGSAAAGTLDLTLTSPEIWDQASPLLRADRRDHRRTQRGKRRLRTTRTSGVGGEALVQPRLFKNLM